MTALLADPEFSGRCIIELGVPAWLNGFAGTVESLPIIRRLVGTLINAKEVQ